MTELIAAATENEFWEKVWEITTSEEVFVILERIAAICFLVQILLKILNLLWGLLRNVWGKLASFFASTGVAGGAAAVTLVTPFLGDELAVGAIWLISMAFSALLSGISVFFLFSRRGERDNPHSPAG